MATKDRTALKDEFKNGNLATGERFADLIDSMKTVQEPVADPAASGTSLSFIDSISQDADGKITATKKTLDLANAHELNPFKGWYKTGDTLPTDGFDGAYLYFKNTSEPTGQTTIYRWNGTAYADTGTVVDTSNVQTFGSGQAVNEIFIDNDFVGGNDKVAGAEEVKSLNNRTKGYTINDTMNSFLKFVSIDLSGYNGSTPIGELALVIWNGESNFYGFQIYNDNVRWIEKYRYSSTETCYSYTSQGVKVYIEVDKSKLANLGTSIGRYKINDSALRWDSRIDKINTLETTIDGLSSDIDGLKTDIDSIQYGPNAVNQISGLATGTPNQIFLQNATASALRYGVSNEVDTVSPFADIIGWGIRLIPFGSGRSYYYNPASGAIEDYPNDIWVSYWLNGSEIITGATNNTYVINWSIIDSDSNYIDKFLQLKPIINYGVGYETTLTSTITNFTVSKNIKCVYSKSGWYQVIEHWNITWQETKKPWRFGIRLGATTTNHPFTIVNPQISYSELPAGKCVINDIDNSINPYPSTISNLSEEVDNLQDSVEEINNTLNEITPSKPNKLHITFIQGSESYILSPFNETSDIKLNFVLRRSVSATHNQSFNFSNVKLVDKLTLTETNVHGCGDDICPSNFNGTYMGGNHANANLRKLTITNHGLTYSNIGEVWTYGTNGEATILGILDADNIIAAGKNTSVYPKFNFSAINENDILSHNGSSLTVSASEYYQWFSSTNQPEIIVLADGEVITEDGDYEFNTLKICEAYDIMNTASQISIIQNNVGTYTSTPNPTNIEGADKVARHSIVYQFDSANQWFIVTTFTAYQDINLSRFGYTQQATIGTNSVHLYIPKTLPIVDEASTIFDFRTAPLYTSHTGVLNLTSTYWENPNLPPDRWLTYNDNIALHSGFFYDYGVGGNNRKDCVNNAFYLPSNNKTYINGIDNKLTINAGDSYSGINWRTYIDRTKVMNNGVISLNLVEYDDKLYIYADFNQTGIYEITIPDSYLGKTIEVFEKSDNITLLTPISNRKVLVKVDTANPMYGYIVAQIKR